MSKVIVIVLELFLRTSLKPPHDFGIRTEPMLTLIGASLKESLIFNSFESEKYLKLKN